MACVNEMQSRDQFGHYLKHALIFLQSTLVLFAHFFSYRSCKPLKIQPISKKEKISHTFTQFKHLSLLELEFFLTHCDVL